MTYNTRDSKGRFTAIVRYSVRDSNGRFVSRKRKSAKKSLRRDRYGRFVSR
jgi:hypothetical protein